ncbi:MAG TPA: hypothetical protein VM054_02985 [bacterium]|nr:hypothetical protein [bacterium]
MRQFLLVLMAGLALILGGCTTTTGDGDGDQVDTQAFYPNDKDNYWTYEVTGDDARTETWTCIDDPDYILANGQQRVRIQDAADADDTYIDVTYEDNEEDSLIYEGVEIYEDGSRELIYFWDDDPWMLLNWKSDGLDVGDNWDSWSITGFNYPEIFGISDTVADELGFDLTADVVDTDEFDYNGETLTAYVIEITGDIIFELDGVDEDQWHHYAYQKDYYFVPEFGYVAIQEYTEQYEQMVPTNHWTLTDTNVPVPE